MPLRRNALSLVSSAATALALAAAACTAGNGGFSPEPLYTPPETTDGDTKVPPGGGDADTRPPADAGTDARKPDGATEGGPQGPAASDVRIQELYVDHDGFGDGAEYVELRGAPGTPVSDLALRIVGEDGSIDYEVPCGAPGDLVGASGTWVVGGPSVFKVDAVQRVDKTVSVASWGLPNARGAVQLVLGPSRVLLDVIGWTDQADGGGVPAPPTDPKATKEGGAVSVPSIAKHALGRKTGAADTNDNRVDVCSMAASIGSSTQKACD